MAVLSEEQTMLRDMTREWAGNEAPVSAFRALRNAGSRAGYDSAAWTQLSEMGLAGIVVPEAFGGTAFGYLSLGLVLEQLGRTLAATPLASTAPAASAIAMGGSAAQQQAWLPRIATGELVATLATEEGAVHDPAATATRVENGRLTGSKRYVAEGDTAGLFVVSAADGLYLVDGSAPGITRSARHMVDARSHADIHFDEVPAEKLSVDTGAIIDRATAAVTAEMLGLAVQAFETTNDYLKTRVQFGQKLSTFQALQHRMARMFTELELMRSVVEGAMEAIDAGRSDAAQTISLAKAVGGDTVKLVSREMIQLHGGIGMTDEHDAGLYLKRAAVLEAMYGNAAWHRERFARLNGY